MDIIDELLKIVAKFDQDGVDYGLCGGLAMAVYNMPRATLDIDLLIQVESLDHAMSTVEPLGYNISTIPMEFHDGKIKISRITKIDSQTHQTLALDLMLVTEEIAAAWESRQEVEWEGRKLKMVSPEGLILLKSFRQSGQDLDDINYLRGLLDETRPE